MQAQRIPGRKRGRPPLHPSPMKMAVHNLYSASAGPLPAVKIPKKRGRKPGYKLKSRVLMTPLALSPPRSTPEPDLSSIPQDAATVPSMATPQALAVCLYINKQANAGPYLERRKVQRLPEHFGPERPSAVLQQAVQACIDCARQQKLVFSLVKQGYGGEMVSVSASFDGKQHLRSLPVVNSVGYVLRFLAKLCRSLLCDDLFSHQPFPRCSSASEKAPEKDGRMQPGGVSRCPLNQEGWAKRPQKALRENVMSLSEQEQEAGPSLRKEKSANLHRSPSEKKLAERSPLDVGGVPVCPSTEQHVLGTGAPGGACMRAAWWQRRSTQAKAVTTEECLVKSGGMNRYCMDSSASAFNHRGPKPPSSPLYCKRQNSGESHLRRGSATTTNVPCTSPMSSRGPPAPGPRPPASSPKRNGMYPEGHRCASGPTQDGQDARRPRAPNPSSWTVEDVVWFVKDADPQALGPHVELFRKHEIDGNALLLLKSDVIMKYLGLKLGPALKLCYHIDKLKEAKF
ncbi:sex comb on midleg-like protein 4 [Dasypus novemcinctus]|uniref:sex comb on midleg-like protein 4 n=1 Tax=Dasypus novemcinctus TaxID=9361 RepID=UPI00062AAB76|nr:sex comb on midleg-like protein 4 [Dasypus novemcinctus]